MEKKEFKPKLTRFAKETPTCELIFSLWVYLVPFDSKKCLFFSAIELAMATEFANYKFWLEKKTLFAFIYKLQVILESDKKRFEEFYFSEDEYRQFLTKLDNFYSLIKD